MISTSQKTHSFRSLVVELWNVWFERVNKWRIYKAEFRFYREDIYNLAEQLQLPDEIITYNGLVVASVPALYMYLWSATPILVDMDT